MTFGIRTFSAYLGDADRLLQEAPPLGALDRCVGRLADVLGFDSAWYGFMSWGSSNAADAEPSSVRSPSAVMHGTATLNLPDDFFRDWQAMCHEDLLLEQIGKAPQRVATYRRGQPVQTEGLIAMADRYDLGSIATATQLRPGSQGALFLACYRNGGKAVRGWHPDEQDFLYSAVEVLDRHIRNRADGAGVVTGEGVELHVSAAGYCVFGAARLRALGFDVDGPLGHALQAAFRLALSRSGRLVSDDLGLIITASPARAEDGSGLRVVHVMPISPLARLSPREIEVAALLAQGLSHKEVARELGIAPATVRNQTSRIYDKLGVKNRATLAAALATTASDRALSA